VRNDGVQHFAMAASLTPHLGPATTSHVGVAREVNSAIGSLVSDQDLSGFETNDIQHNEAGIDFALKRMENHEAKPSESLKGRGVTD